MNNEHFDYVLRIADNALILSQRLSEWCGHAPVLEEDLALANIALDLIGQARLLLTHAGALEGKGRDEDQLAFLRSEGQYFNVTMVELPNGDFGRTTLRNFLFSAFQRELWQALRESKDQELAAIAAKSLKETRYHLRHCADWVVRLGDGTDESRFRMQSALASLWPYCAEIFAEDGADRAVAAAGLGVQWSSLEPGWLAIVIPTLDEATLAVPAPSAFRSEGKCGAHSEHMGRLLTEMQYLQRTFPGSHW
ncbi:MAG: 1,2-phenylacetyl-CoA epoxidase subunit PaaC [Burkholderiales bacterium]